MSFQKNTFCWRLRRRHRFQDTGALKLVRGSHDPPGRGRVLRCCDCGHLTAAVGKRLERLLELGNRQ